MAKRSKDELGMMESVAGVLLSIMTTLRIAIQKRGGDFNSLRRLTTPEGAETVEKIADLIMPSVKRIIDCDANPFVYDNWKVEEHQKGGQFEWNPDDVRLHLSSNQQNYRCIDGYDLRKELSGQPTLNANALDYFLKNPEFIPNEWKGKHIFFWGTIYRDSAGNLCVRYLGWGGGKWDWSDYWLGAKWNDHCPAVVRASD
ncbi:MAG: hypothetical protein HQ536_02930 [Parcubacteria group bacterium]|nr:hypothetical protein [Parcubacteria group bacterium]